MADERKTSLSETKRLMAALGRMPPKPHEEMKLGRATKPKKQKVRKKKRGD